MPFESYSQSLTSRGFGHSAVKSRRKPGGRIKTQPVDYENWLWTGSSYSGPLGYYFYATFSVEVTGCTVPYLGYQWQESTDGGATWANVGTGTASLSVLVNASAVNIPTIAASYDGRKYRCKITTSTGLVLTSTVATLWVDYIVTQPVNKTIWRPDPVTFGPFTVHAHTSPAYKWQLYQGSNIYNDIPGETKNTLTLTNTAAGVSTQARRCVATNAFGTVNSADVTFSQATSYFSAYQAYYRRDLPYGTLHDDWYNNGVSRAIGKTFDSTYAIRYRIKHDTSYLTGQAPISDSDFYITFDISTLNGVVRTLTADTPTYLELWANGTIENPAAGTLIVRINFDDLIAGSNSAPIIPGSLMGLFGLPSFTAVWCTDLERQGLGVDPHIFSKKMMCDYAYNIVITRNY